MGVEERIGSLAPGKDADLCIWSGEPLDVMSRVEQAWVDGRLVYRYDPERQDGVFSED